MSHIKKKRQIFLLSKLTLLDYLTGLVVLSGLILFAYIMLSDSYDDPAKFASQVVPVRSVRMTTISQLWSRDGVFLSEESHDMRFFTTNGRSLIFPTINETQTAHALRAIDITTGQVLWQSDVPNPSALSIYNSKIFILSSSDKSLEEAPVQGNQKLPYCSFQQKRSLSTYDINTGQPVWGYNYLGINSGSLTFIDDLVHLVGTAHNGQSQLIASIQTGSGMILNQQCARIGDNNPLPDLPRNSDDGTLAASFTSASINNREESDFGCARDKRYCFIADGNRLTVLNGTTKDNLGFVEFNGDKLTAYLIDIVVQNNLVVIHLNDSNQLFAFRLP